MTVASEVTVTYDRLGNGWSGAPGDVRGDRRGVPSGIMVVCMKPRGVDIANVTGQYIESRRLHQPLAPRRTIDDYSDRCCKEQDH